MYLDTKVLKRSQEHIAQGCLTNSKHPCSYIFGIYPSHVMGGDGCRLIDPDGRKYIDFICGLGANLYGYGNPHINFEISQFLNKGFSHSLPTIYEVDLAERLKAIFPFVDLFKFVKTGSEATMAALRMARAYTGRKEVLSEGYHGWHDEFTSLTPPADGVMEHKHIKKLTDLEQITSDTAAVILEPIMIEHSLERVKWLNQLREKCSEVGAVLIFDEIITGYRFLKYSVSRQYNINPDILLIGKAMANGMPIAAIGGNKDILSGNYFVSSTFAGELISIAAALAVLKAKNKYDIETLWKKGEYFIEGFNKLVPDVKIEGYPTRGVFVGKKENIDLFFQESAKARILFGKSFLFNYPLVEEIDHVLGIVKEVGFKINNNMAKLEGMPSVSPLSWEARNYGQGKPSKVSADSGTSKRTNRTGK